MNRILPFPKPRLGAFPKDLVILFLPDLEPSPKTGADRLGVGNPNPKDDRRPPDDVKRNEESGRREQCACEGDENEGGDRTRSVTVSDPPSKAVEAIAIDQQPK